MALSLTACSPCVNPSHLFLGTSADNNRDCASKGRLVHGVKHHNAVLDPEKVRFIRSSPLSMNKLKVVLGVSFRTVQMVRSGITWKHVT